MADTSDPQRIQQMVERGKNDTLWVLSKYLDPEDPRLEMEPING